jgi:hypothetical protein
MPARQLQGVQWESKAEIVRLRPAVLPVKQSGVALVAAPQSLNQQRHISRLAEQPAEGLQIALAQAETAVWPRSKEADGALLAASFRHSAGYLDQCILRFPIMRIPIWGGAFSGKDQLEVFNNGGAEGYFDGAAQQDSARFGGFRNPLNQTRHHVQAQVDAELLRGSPRVEIARIVPSLSAHHCHIPLSDDVPSGQAAKSPIGTVRVQYQVCRG